MPSSSFNGTQQIDVKAGYALQDQQAETIVRAQPLVTTHSESVPLQILPLMGSDQISANSSEGSVVIRGQYFGKALSPTQKIVVNLDGQNFDAKMTDQKGVFNAAIDMQNYCHHQVSNLLLQLSMEIKNIIDCSPL